MTSLMLYVPSFCVSTLQSTQFMSVPFRELHFIHCLFGSLKVVSLHQLNEKGYNFFPVCTHMQEYVKTFNLSGLFVEF